MIKVVLIGLILALLFWFLANRKTSKASAGIKLGMIGFVLIAMGVVIFPEASNDIAHLLGVGRGADLILYMLTVAFIFSNLAQYIKNKEEQQKIATLARKIAIIDANEKYRTNWK